MKCKKCQTEMEEKEESYFLGYMGFWSPPGDRVYKCWRCGVKYYPDDDEWYDPAQIKKKPVIEFEESPPF